MMPHWPFLNDSLGNIITENNFKKLEPAEDMSQYLRYLKYTNGYILKIIDELKKTTNNQAVIVLMSDHGYRRFSTPPTGSGNYNLNATFIPDGNYDYFYDSISNVNQMRVVLNNVFRTRLAIKKDSIIY